MPRKNEGIKVTIVVTPTKGDPQSNEVTVRNPTVGDAIIAAKLSAVNHDVTLNGEPADLSTPIAAGDRVGIAERTRGA